MRTSVKSFSTDSANLQLRRSSRRERRGWHKTSNSTAQVSRTVTDTRSLTLRSRTACSARQRWSQRRSSATNDRRISLKTVHPCTSGRPPSQRKDEGSRWEQRQSILPQDVTSTYKKQSTSRSVKSEKRSENAETHCGQPRRKPRKNVSNG